MSTETTSHTAAANLDLQKCPTGIVGLDDITGGE